MVDRSRLLLAAGLSVALALTASVGLHAAGRSSLARGFPPSNDYSMGPAPQNCPTVESDLVHVAHDNRPNVFPRTYWWIGSGTLVAHSGWQVSNGQVFLTFGVRSRYGYPQKVGWQFMQSADGPVTLHGWNLRTHQPIWFGHPLPGAASAVIAWPGGILRDHQGPDLIFVPAAGCYQLQAQWKGGSWNLFFSAGCSADRRLFGVAHCR